MILKLPSYFCTSGLRGERNQKIFLLKEKEEKINKIRESILVTYENRLKNKLIKRRSQEHEAFNFRSLVHGGDLEPEITFRIK